MALKWKLIKSFEYFHRYLFQKTHSIHANSRIFDTYESRVEEMMLI